MRGRTGGAEGAARKGKVVVRGVGRDGRRMYLSGGECRLATGDGGSYSFDLVHRLNWAEWIAQPGWAIRQGSDSGEGSASGTSISSNYVSKEPACPTGDKNKTGQEKETGGKQG